MEASVKDFMVPIAKFPRISDTATFSGAVMALERANEEYLSGKREQRILLVTDSENKVVGKLSPLDVVRGLEPDYEKLVDEQSSVYVEKFSYVIQPMKEQTTLWAKPSTTSAPPPRTSWSRISSSRRNRPKSSTMTRI